METPVPISRITYVCDKLSGMLEKNAFPFVKKSSDDILQDQKEIAKSGANIEELELIDQKDVQVSYNVLIGRLTKPKTHWERYVRMRLDHRIHNYAETVDFNVQEIINSLPDQIATLKLDFLHEMDFVFLYYNKVRMLKKTYQEHQQQDEQPQPADMSVVIGNNNSSKSKVKRVKQRVSVRIKNARKVEKGSKRNKADMPVVIGISKGKRGKQRVSTRIENARKAEKTLKRNKA